MIKAVGCKKECRWQKEAELYKHGSQLASVLKEATFVFPGLLSQLPNESAMCQSQGREHQDSWPEWVVPL